MKKIILISINARYTHLNLATLYLREMIKELPFKCILQDFTINTPFLDILQEISSLKPDILAFSIYIWNTSIVKNLLKEIKKILPDVKIILGGPEVSYNSDIWLNNYPEIDFIITGKGEKSLYTLLKNNLKSETKIIQQEDIDFNKIPFPYLKDDFIKYKNCYIYFESQRGCPYKCSYCLSSRFDQSPEFRNIDRVLKELDIIIKHKPKTVKFIDRTFNLKKNHYRTIWNYLIEKSPDTIFHFEIHPLLLENEDFDILRKASPQQFQFEIGIQSIYPKTSKAINRKDNWPISYNNIKKLCELNLFHIHLGLIAGLPYDSLKTFKETFNQAISLNPQHLQLGFLKVLPGTKMAKKADAWGIKYLSSPSYHILESKWISFEELSYLKAIEVAVNLIHNSQKFKKTFKYLYPLFKSPFEFYKLFIKYTNNKYKLHHKDWVKTATYLLEFIDHIIPHKKDLILDALRWDWSDIAKANYYPPVIHHEIDKQLINIKNKIKKKLIEKNVIPSAISPKEFNKTIVFIPFSKKFKESENLNESAYIKANGILQKCNS